MGIFPLARLTSALWASRITDPITSERLLDLFAERYIFGVCILRCAVKPESLAVRGNSNRLKEGNKMKPSTKDEVVGEVHEVKGKVKEKAGQLTNNPDLEAEGQDEKIGGKVQKKIGKVEKVLGK